ncbi:MAG: DNA polymerase III subunit alpha [Micropruina sp.]|nr:DNA polymerase III subunit alpha [Micropruina sp.]
MGDGSAKPIQDVAVGDEITSVSTWNLRGQTATVEKALVREVDEELCVIRPFGQVFPVQATAEHPFLVDSKGWVAASDVRPGDWLLLPQAVRPDYQPFDLHRAAIERGWTTQGMPDGQFVRLCTSELRAPRAALGSMPRLVDWSEDLMWLIGLWVAEGHVIDPAATGSPGQIGWTLHKDEPAVERLCDTIRRLGLGEPRTYGKASACAPDHQGVTIMLTHHPLALFLQALAGCGVRTKQLHPWIMSLPDQGIRAFIAGWLEGDGYRDRTRVGVTTVNAGLARQLRSLLLMTGQWATVERSPSQQAYRVKWIPSRTKAPYNARCVDGRWWVRVRSTGRERYRGTVHNLTVTGDHTYVAEGIAVHNCGYFLVVADFINWAKNNGIRVGPGRGSGAGSMCAYALRITDLDPVPHGLIFERFLNPERPSMPDFDIDFDERRRGEVIRYVTEKYGDDHVCQIVTYGTIKAKQAIKDAGRVLGKPFGLGERITKAYTPPVMGKDVPLPEVFNPQHARYAEGGEFRALYESDPEVKEVVDTARGIEGLKRQWGVHAAGVIMSSAPLLDVIPVMKRESDGQIITQFDYPSCESLGLVKMDFLGLRNLTILDDAITNVKANRGIDLDLDELSKDPTDAKTYELLATGDTLGIFQLDGSGMRVLLRQMQPDNFEDISAALALYRPGPMGANSHTNYALRKTGKQPITAIHPELAEPLAEILDLTYGLIVYQEQVQQIAVKVANYTLGAADQLRRAMGKKKKEVLDAEFVHFESGMQANGFSAGAIKALWDILVPFSDYAFNKAHTAAYGLISYWTAYLKANYPAEYMAALLQSVKDDKDKSAVYLAECRRMGIKVLPPDVNESVSMFTPIGTDIRYGLAAIRNVGENVVRGIVEGREANGPSTDFNSFLDGVPLVVCNKRVIESLIKAGAFDSLGHARRGLMECYEQKVDEVIDLKRNEANGQDDLFGDAGGGEAMISSPVPAVEEWDKRIRLAFEREMLGLYVSDHPLLGLEHVLLANRDHSVGQIMAEDGPRDIQTTIAGMITQVTRKQTKNGDLWAIVTVEDLEASIEVLLFPKVYQHVAMQLATDTVVRIKGRVVGKDEGVEMRGTDVSFPDVSEGPSGPVVISLPAARCTPAVVQQLRTVLTSHPGATEVRVRLTTSSNRTTLWKLEETLRVMPSPPLMADLKALLGPSCVSS